MRMNATGGRQRLFALCGIYCLASLAHFAHNAEFLGAYPNMPAWLSRFEVYAAWLAITALGAVALMLTNGRFVLAGLLLTAVYATLGFDGLAHYALAPVSAHTLVMNLTIGCEVAAAALLLVCALHGVFDEGRRRGARRRLP